MKALQIELKKLMTYKVFWGMVALYVLAVVFVYFGFPSLIDYFSVRSGEMEFKLLKKLIYNFPDTWQNLAWLGSLRFFIKIFLGFIVIIIVTNEFSYGTVRINIINGMNRWDFLKGKIHLIILFSLVATLLVILSGLILGLVFSSNTSLAFIVKKWLFLPGYFVEVFTYMSFALLLGILLKKAGMAISILFAYPIVELIISQQLNEKFRPYLPVNAMNEIIRTPNTSLIQYSSPNAEIELQTHIAGQDIVIALAYAALFLFISYLILKKRDL
jgi:ABC-type transport system involved in multi-copper enzyme maturation permease subunit